MLTSLFGVAQRAGTARISRLRQMSHSSATLTNSSDLGNRRGPVEEQIRTKLVEALQPDSLVIANDSSKHSSHAAMRAVGGGNGETHFAVEVVSEAFEGKSTIQRHRLIYAILDDELKSGVHALQLKTKTPSEMIAR